MKSILLVGLGRFGRHMAEKFIELGHEVLAVDTNEQRVNDILPIVTDAQIGDATDEQFVASLGVRNFDLCVVCIGNNFQSSLEATALLKDLGAVKVLSRASRDVHAKFLLRNGADYVVYPEKEMAMRSAVKFSADNIFDYVSLSPEYSIYEVKVPGAWVGRSIIELSVRTRYHISILAFKHGDTFLPLPKPDHVFTGDETMLVLGGNADRARRPRKKRRPRHWPWAAFSAIFPLGARANGPKGRGPPHRPGRAGRTGRNPSGQARRGKGARGPRHAPQFAFHGPCFSAPAHLFRRAVTGPCAGKTGTCRRCPAPSSAQTGPKRRWRCPAPSGPAARGAAHPSC